MKSGLMSVLAASAATVVGVVAHAAGAPADPAQRARYCSAKASHMGQVIEAMKANEPFRFANEPNGLHEWTAEALKLLRA
ncbi:conserved hypothetical protein [Ricinus communis]|uniref:Uncharacterized protein n=1 Tax=Ricinus communis TaxID=3988 RepID=B9TET5_RICCO|nr:conserved hypothetical protein [Ricinus communis]